MTKRLKGSNTSIAECAERMAGVFLPVRIICLFALILSAPALRAADAGEESEPASTEESTQDASSQAQTNASGSQKRRAGDKGGVFRPTEDISEDAAITFPVDI